MRVDDHDFFFTGRGRAQAIPYGIYDVAANRGWVNVGTDHDTAAFAVESIRRWWRPRPPRLPGRDPAADHRRRRRVQRLPHPGVEDRAGGFAAETGLEITVCHFPPGTSKWNKIEVRHEAPLLTGQG